MRQAGGAEEGRREELIMQFPQILLPGCGAAAITTISALLGFILAQDDEVQSNVALPLLFEHS